MNSFETQTVWIPTASKRSGAILIIDAVDQPRGEAPKGRGSPQVARLLELNLYAMAEAMQRLVGKYFRARFGRLSRTRRTAYLENDTQGSATSLDTHNQDSAQLGLALIILAYEGQLPIRTFVATGRLVEEHGQYRIKPVGGLENKFRAIADQVSASRGGRFNGVLPLISPRYTSDGEEVARVHAKDIDTVICAGRDIGIVVEHLPTEDLDALLSKLGHLKPFKARWPLITAIFAGTLTIAAAILAIWLANTSRVEIASSAVMRTGSGELVAIPKQYQNQPLRVVADATAQLQCPLLAPSDGHAYPRLLVGDQLALSLEMPAEPTPASLLAPVFLQVGTLSAPTIAPFKAWPADDVAIALGANGPHFSVTTPVVSSSGNPQEYVLVGAGATRGRINMERLSKEISAAVEQADKDRPVERLNRASEIFAARLPGARFWTVHVDPSRVSRKGSCDVLEVQ